MIVREYKKLFIRYILLLVAIPAMQLSCVYEEFDTSIGEIVEGEPATVSLTVQLPAMTSVTRAGGISPDSNEASHVNDLWVGIYNADTGERSGYYYDTHNEVFDNNHNSGHHTINIKDAVSGRCYIVAVANVANNRGIDITGDESEPLTTLLENATTWEKYKNLAITLISGPQSIAYSGPGMLMSGIYYDDAKDNHSSHNYQDVIDDDGNPNSGGAAPVIIRPGKNDLNGCIQLRRVAAYVKFNIQVSEKYKEFITFTPVSWQVCNLPGVSYVHERKGSDNAADKVLHNLPEDYESNSYHNSLIYDGIQLFPTRDGVSSFDFYQMENKHMAVGDLSDYNEREAEYTFTTAADNGKNTGWYKSLVSEQEYYSKVAETQAVPTYGSPLANNNASYVIIRAHLEYYYLVNDPECRPVAPPTNSNDAGYIRRVGDAIYTIHLGYCEGKDNNQPTAATLNDFNCRRNTRYTYNIYVSGVDQIRVEAVAEGDGDEGKTNGVEGTVTDVTSNVISLDSHYGVFNIQMTDRERMDLSWRIQSPFGDDIIDMMHNSDKFENFDTPGIINLNSEANSDKVKALPINQFYNWVQFRPTSGENVLAHYPGDPRLIGRTIENPDPQPGSSDIYDTSKIPDYATSGSNADDGTGVWYIEQLKNVADCPHTDVANDPNYAGYREYVSKIQAGEYVTPNQEYDRMLDNISRWYTVYVDEYVYEYNYNPGLPSLTGENDDPGYVNDVMDITDWRYFVNRPNRSMWIAINNSHTSSDMESIYSNASYFITQESIQTYYSNNAEQGIGIECTNESYIDRALGWTDYNQWTYDDVDGLYNQYRYVVDKQYGVSRWYHVLRDERGNTMDINEKALPQTQYANLNNKPRVGVLRHGTDVWSDRNHTFYIPDHVDNYMDACLARNRDLNNDGIIGANEIRWYLPTTSTYTRIILGSTSLRSPLFNLTEFAPESIQAGGGTLYSHYLGSNNRIVWAEELAATGMSNQGQHGNIRCIRNLGQKMNLHPNPNSDDYDTIDAAYHHDEGTHTVELDFYNMTALRDYTNGTIAAHPVGDIRSYAARKFQYANEDCNRQNTGTGDRYFNEFGELINTVVWRGLSDGRRDFSGWWDILEHNSVCGQYSEESGTDRGTWRVPNITELAIMKILNIISDREPVKHPWWESEHLNRYISCSYEYFLNRRGWGIYPDTQKFIMGVANNVGTFDISADINGHFDVSVRCVRDVK